MGTIRLRHKEGCTGVAFTPNGRQLVTAADDGLVCFWKLPNGQALRKIPAAKHRVSALALAPNGEELATADGEAIRVWDASTGRQRRAIACPNDLHNPGPLVFSSDGTILAAVAKDGSIRLFQTATGKEHRVLPSQASGIRCLAFTSDGKRLVVVGRDAASPVRIWDLVSGRLTHELSIDSSKDMRIRPLALSSDGGTLAVECATQERVKKGREITVFTQYRLCLWDVATGRERLRTVGERDVLWAAAFSADGKQVATAGMGDQVRIWDATTGQLRGAFQSNPGGSRPDALDTMAFSPDGRRLALVGAGAAVQIWDLALGGPIVGLPDGHQGTIGALAYGPDGATVASASDDGTIRLWNAATGQVRSRLQGHAAAVRALAFSPDGQTLASADERGLLGLWDPATGKELRSIQAVPQTAGFYSGIGALAFTLEGQRLASWGDDYRVRFWQVSTGEEILDRALLLRGVSAGPLGRPPSVPPEAARVQDARFGRDGRSAAVAIGGTIHFLDLAAAREVFQRPGHDGPMRLAISGDSRTVASGGWDKQLRVWDVITGQELLRTQGDDFITAVAIAQDSRTVAVATGWAHGAISLLDSRTGKLLLRLQGHASYVGTLAFSPDGQTLASGQRDTTVLVWDLKPGLRRLGAARSELSPEELQTNWAQLADADAKKARAAVEALAAAPGAAEPLLKGQLRPVKRAQLERIQRLIADLDSEQFATREAATTELAALGEEAESALRRALVGTLSVEARRRVEALLKGPTPHSIPNGEQLRRLRAIHVLEQIGSPEAAHLLAELAEGAPSARETLEAKAASERLAHRVSRP
jgi:WD40 repeat protein